ncbi:MAG: SUMF1/EgtB/PvdO family nonheme iron enzyme [Planctomycetes bacterium]|nr:SUMF1/EgtB/PvdO family nonheme iron enzyme [Planctomycetota bacterium]
MADTTVQILNRILFATGKADRTKLGAAAQESADTGGFLTTLLARRLIGPQDVMDVLLNEEVHRDLAELDVLSHEEVERIRESEFSILQALENYRTPAPARPAPETAPTRPATEKSEEVHGRKMRELAEALSATGRYRMEGTIGIGGMGKVLEVQDLSIGRTVAMKIVTPRGTAEQKEWILRHFQEEGQMSGQLEHPNIMPVYDMGVLQGGIPYFTMKRVQGESLESILEKMRGEKTAASNESQHRLLQVFCKVCDAVAYAGARGVVHRDLKPSNVMVGEYGEVFVLDWGIAKVLDRALEDSTVEPVLLEPAKAGRTLQGTVTGTPWYMSPEQADGRTGEIDHRTDVYALGAILYEILALTPPHGALAPEKVVQRILTKSVVPPHIRAPGRGIPRELSSIALKALSRAPEDRYPTAGELEEDIHRFLDNRPVLAHVDPLARRIAKWLRRHPVLSASLTTGIILGGLAGSLGVLSVHYERREAERRLALEIDYRDRARRDAEAEAARLLLDDARSVFEEAEVALAPHRVALAYPLSIAPGDWEALGPERAPQIPDEDIRAIETLLERVEDLAARAADREAGAGEARELSARALLGLATLEIHRAREKGRLATYPAASKRLALAASAAGTAGPLAAEIEHWRAWAGIRLPISVRVQPGGGTVEIWKIPANGVELPGTLAGAISRLSVANLCFLEDLELRTEAEAAGLLVERFVLPATGEASRDLPPGDYLLVFARGDFVRTRFPLRLVREFTENRHIAFPLVPQENAPEGMAYVPAAVSLSAKGDRWVRTSGFFISLREATNGEWMEFLSAPDGDPSLRPKTSYSKDASADDADLWQLFDLGNHPDFKRLPVAGVSYSDVVRFIEWKNRGSSHVYRLPTEDEWERAGGAFDGRRYPWGNSFSESLTNMRDTRERVPHTTYDPVDSVRDGRSIYGCHHMAGNVAELTATTGHGDETHISKGEGYSGSESGIRLDRRENEDDSDRSSTRGFRVAASLP